MEENNFTSKANRWNFRRISLLASVVFTLLLIDVIAELPDVGNFSGFAIAGDKSKMLRRLIGEIVNNVSPLGIGILIFSIVLTIFLLSRDGKIMTKIVRNIANSLYPGYSWIIYPSLLQVSSMLIVSVTMLLMPLFANPGAEMPTVQFIGIVLAALVIFFVIQALGSRPFFICYGGDFYYATLLTGFSFRLIQPDKVRVKEMPTTKMHWFERWQIFDTYGNELFIVEPMSYNTESQPHVEALLKSLDPKIQESYMID